MQNRCLRVQSGLHRSAPVESVRLEAGAESFATSLKREAALAYEKAVRLPETTHPTTQLANRPRQRRWVKGTSWRELAMQVSTAVGLSALPRLPLPPPSKDPREKGSERYTISLTLKGGSSRDSPQNQRMTDALETIRSHGATDVTFYTDGSAAGGTVDGGCAVVLTTGDPGSPTVLEVRHRRGPAFTTSFETEGWALLDLVEWTEEWPERRRILVCTDSQSALSALREGDVKGHTILVRLYRLLYVSPHDFVFQWVPGHCSLPGNERADEEAGKAAGDNSLDTLNQTPISYQVAKALLRARVKDPPPVHPRTREVYEAGEPRRVLLRRDEEVLLARLRSGHSAHLSAHRARMNPALDPTCPVCGEEPEDLSHWLQRCSVTLAQRVTHFGTE